MHLNNGYMGPAVMAELTANMLWSLKHAGDSHSDKCSFGLYVVLFTAAISNLWIMSRKQVIPHDPVWFCLFTLW